MFSRRQHVQKPSVKRPAIAVVGRMIMFVEPCQERTNTNHPAANGRDCEVPGME